MNGSVNGRLRSEGCLHGSLCLIALFRVVGSIQILLLGSAGRITAAAAVSAALEALATATAASDAAAEAANYACNDSKEDQSSDDNDCNYGPLAEVGGHAVVPTGNGSLEVIDLGPGVVDDVPFLNTGSDAPGDAVGDNLPHTPPQAPGHGNVDGRHREAGVMGRVPPDYVPPRG